MFKCEECKRVTEPTEKQHKKVVETRDVTYKGNHEGQEIVKELNVCSDCVTD